MQNKKSKPAKTLTKQIVNGAPRKYSTFDDLAQWAVDLGRAGSVQEVREHRSDLWGDLVFEWYTQAQIACIFAASLAREAEKVSWIHAVVSGRLDANAVTAVIDAAAEDGAEAIQLLFPGAGDAHTQLKSFAAWVLTPGGFVWTLAPCSRSHIACLARLDCGGSRRVAITSLGRSALPTSIQCRSREDSPVRRL